AKLGTIDVKRHLRILQEAAHDEDERRCRQQQERRIVEDEIGCSNHDSRYEGKSRARILEQWLELRDDDYNEENNSKDRHCKKNGGVDERGDQIGAKLFEAREMLRELLQHLAKLAAGFTGPNSVDDNIRYPCRRLR